MIFLDRGNEIENPFRKSMERNHGLWHFKEKSADRLWHKSAIGKPAEGGAYT